MPRYAETTNGKRKKPKAECSQLSQVKFDCDNFESSEDTTGSECSSQFSQKSREKSVEKREVLIHTTKRRKVVPLHEDDLFGLSELDSDIVSSGKLKCELSGRSSSQSSKSKTSFESSTDGTDKSTDDEAYGSSQEPNISNTFTKEFEGQDEKPVAVVYKRQSPFKYFLKNNMASLSPKKRRLDKRVSPLPCNVNTRKDVSDSQPETFIPQLTRVLSWPPDAISSRVRVNREEKQLFTVVQNVKHKHACLEDGETQQFFDDVDFALDGLREDLSLAARCSSALDLATQCSTPSFRVNLRAHGIMSKIFDCLQDAPSNKTLALCTAYIFYMITRDRLNVDFDNSILGLLLKLLCVNETNQRSDTEKKGLHEEMLRKTRQILTRLPEPYTSYLDLENLSSVSLARESLLSLSSQRTGEWFKEEIRTLGGLDYIVNLVLSSVENIRDTVEELLQNEKAIENTGRCLKLIENVTYQNRENQIYLVSCKKSSLVVALARLMKICTRGIVEDQLASQCLFFKTILDCVKSILRVFLNLTHDNDGESETIGQQDGLMSSLLLCVLQVPQFIAKEEQFDILVLALGLLINLMEHSKQNIASLIVLDTPLSYESADGRKHFKGNGRVQSIEALVHLFQLREEAARMNESVAYNLSDDELRPTKDGLGWVCGHDIDVSRDEDAESDEEHDENSEKSEENHKKLDQLKSLEDEIGDALQKAGEHMEDSMVASYVALLLGCIAQDNKANQHLIRQLLPQKNFTPLINSLKTFLGFMKLTIIKGEMDWQVQLSRRKPETKIAQLLMSGTTGHAIERIIDVLKAC